MLYQLLQYSNVIQLYICVHPFLYSYRYGFILEY